MKSLRRISFIFLLLGLYTSYAQEDTSSRKVVELIFADFIRSMNTEGMTGQRLIGNVKLFHNDTYMDCDSAYLYSASTRFEAFGNIVMTNKDGARLYGDSLYYDGNIDLAQVRGRIVRMVDSTAELRTSYLDFNTKDNIGYFFNGGTITNKENLLESQRGYYYSEQKLFIFRDELQMQDTVYTIRADSAHYYSDTDLAIFFGKTSIWHKDGYLSCLYGWFDRQNDLFHFSSEAYLQTDKQEVWADTINYNRPLGEVEMYSKVQMRDTIEQMLAFADEAYLLENPETVTLTKNPSVAYYSVDSTAKSDTVFVRGDTIKMITYKNPKYYPEETVRQVDSSLNVLPDSLTEHPLEIPLLLPENDSIAAIDSLGRMLETDGIPPPDSLRQIAEEKNKMVIADTLQQPPDRRDSLQIVKTTTEQTPIDSVKIIAEEAVRWVRDSLLKKQPPALVAATDSLPPTDTLLRRVYAYHNVRAYREDGQMVCDSLMYSTLDSITRLYGRPVMWHETYQISSDSMLFHSENQQLTKAEYFSSAFVLFYEQLPNEDTIYYNQVKGRDMIGYFRENDLYRFDVEGGAQTVYFISEDSLIVNMNIAESESLVVSVEERKIQRMTYISKIKSDAYPVDYDVPQEQIMLRGFEIREDERPKTRFEVCLEIPKASRREEISQLPMPSFPITERINALDRNQVVIKLPGKER